MPQSADPLTVVDLAPTAATSAEPARWLALGAVAGPVVFALAWFVLGFVSPGYTLFGTRIAPYSPISQPISGLGVGVTAPFMNAAFIAGGLMLVAGVIGIFRTLDAPGRPGARRASAALLGLCGVGMVIDGIFDLEAMMAHLVGFGLGVVAQVAGFLVADLSSAASR